MDEKHAVLNILENVSDSEIKNLLDGLNKIKDLNLELRRLSKLRIKAV